jgi:AraC-like DNA-binding protein
MLESVPIGAGPFQRLLSVGHRETVLFPELLAMPPEFIHAAGFVEGDKAVFHDVAQRRGDFDLATVWYTVSGRGTLRHQGREFLVEPGDAVVLCYPHDNLSKIEPGERWEMFYVSLCGRAALKMMREITGCMGPVFALDSRSRALVVAATACASALENRIESPRQASELAHTIATSLRDETIGQLHRPTTPRSSSPDFFSEVEQFCIKNLSRPIGVEDMARVAKMSRYYFTRKFGKKRGISPGQFLAALRLDEAKRLLATGGLTVKEVAMQCGYSDANYFGKVFRKNLGISPGSLRFANQRAPSAVESHSPAA